MRAVLTTGHGGLEKIEFRDSHPDPTPAPGEALVRVRATALNFHDVFTRRGMPGVKIRLPVVVGSDIAGTVATVGDDVDSEWVGRNVLVDPVLRSGDRVGMIGETIDGGRAELVAVPADSLIAVPDGVALEDAAALPLAYGTAYRMLRERGRIAAGERVLVLGASGGVGVACVQLAKLFGADVVACASSSRKLERLREIGADHVVDYVQEPFVDAIRRIYGKPRITGSGGVDVAVNFTGGDTLADTQKCVRLRGRILCCGATAGYELTLDARYWWTFEHTMIGSDGWERQDLVELLELVATGRLHPVIDRVMPLHEAAEAERMLEGREVFGKLLLAP
jgi:alcohol dehydrogenase